MIPQVKLGMLAFKILGPIALVIAMLLYHNHAVSKAETRGADSRNAEVTKLTTERDVALADVKTLKGDLFLCRGTKLQAEADVTSLTGKFAALGEEHKAAMKLQADTFAATQRVTANALTTLAKNTKAADIDYAGILAQLKGVNYDVDKETGRCIIRGGGRVLSNAAKGKIGG